MVGLRVLPLAGIDSDHFHFWHYLIFRPSHIVIRVAVRSLSSEKLGHLYQPGGGRPFTNFLENFPNTKFVRGSPVKTLKKQKNALFQEKN